MASRMKTLLYGILLIVLLGIGGLVYRNAVERSQQQVACPLDARVCPDGTTLGRTGLSCSFPACPPPNVSLESLRVAFAIPEGFAAVTASDASVAAQYDLSAASSTGAASIVIRSYPLATSTTALAVIRENAINGASGLPVAATAFTSATFGGRRYTVATVDRFEGVIVTSYYLARSTDVLRFDAVDREVASWMDPKLDLSALPAHRALRSLLGTLQGE